ncbi:hypothetical protein HKBW3S44_01207, partial [Candidatus Hakubella thermalkaliphila]
NPIALCRLVAERLQAEGWHEPYELRGSRTDLWGTGGEIPPVYPAVLEVNAPVKPIFLECAVTPSSHLLS